MKKFIKTCCVILLFFMPEILFAQENVQTFSTNENSLNELPQLIIESSSFFRINQYQYLDGTLFKNHNVRSIISIVPENEDVLKRQRGWEVANTASGILFFGSWITWSVFYVGENLPNADIVRTISGSVFLVSAITTILTGNISSQKMRRAVSNYNLYIQGIPIP